MTRPDRSETPQLGPRRSREGVEMMAKTIDKIYYPYFCILRNG